MSMEDAISRKAAFDACFDMWNKDYKEIAEDIRKLPSVTPAPKIGRWIKIIDDFEKYGIKTCHYECSECGNWSSFGDYNYCSNCGAKMEV